MPTLVVEDGTGLSTANCVISRADADTYHLDRGNAAWGSASTTDRDEALIAGWQYIENKYRTRWKGSRTNRTQALAWPRMASVSSYYNSVSTGVIYDADGHYIDSDEIPAQVKYANAEAALLIIEGVDLEPRLAYGGAVQSKTVKAGPVMTSTTYRDGASTRDVLTVIDGYLSGLINSGLQTKMVRG
jgi:hypothetical protein